MNIYYGYGFAFHANSTRASTTIHKRVTWSQLILIYQNGVQYNVALDQRIHFFLKEVNNGPKNREATAPALYTIMENW